MHPGQISPDVSHVQPFLSQSCSWRVTGRQPVAYGWSAKAASQKSVLYFHLGLCTSDWAQSCGNWPDVNCTCNNTIIMLLLFWLQVSITRRIRPICLPYQPNVLLSSLVVSGWGYRPSGKGYHLYL